MTKKDELKVTLLQMPLVWENVDANLNFFTDKISRIKEQTDVIVLPEMFSTGFTMSSKTVAETMIGKAIQWMRQQAAAKNCVLTGSIITKEKGKYYNRLIWMRPDGSFEKYDKRHLFRMANEQKYYSKGKQKRIVELKGWKICLMVCYDLRFPVWSRRVANTENDYDVLLYVANWPERRSHAWKSLLVARAIENQSYVLGLNRVGLDGNNINYSGDSAVLNYLGEPMSNFPSNKESIETTTISKKKLLDFRKSFPAELDADSFEIKQ